MKYVLTTGGVLSGIGKGILASSTGLILQSLGFHVSCIKIDPYLNIDAGTFSPYEHGETFVLDDGGECDLDLGNYERFLGLRLTAANNITTGKIYSSVIEKERRGEFLGKTVQVIPHITDEIQNWIQSVSKIPLDGSEIEPEICIIELGGTIGDIESAPFVEALRQLQFKVGLENFCCMHVSLLPTIQNELKTKPTQHSVKELRSLGLSPDIIFARASQPIGEDIKKKLSLFCQVPTSNVISCPEVKNTQSVPLSLYDQGLWQIICRKLELNVGPEKLKIDVMAKWRELVQHQDLIEEKGEPVKIAVVGKYVQHVDTYVSVLKALQHASLAADRKLVLLLVDSEDLEKG